MNEMIRLLLILLVLAVSLAIVCAEVYALLWVFTHGMKLAGRHPWATIVVAVVFLVVNWAYARDARKRRAQWREDFFSVRKA